MKLSIRCQADSSPMASCLAESLLKPFIRLQFRRDHGMMRRRRPLLRGGARGGDGSRRAPGFPPVLRISGRAGIARHTTGYVAHRPGSLPGGSSDTKGLAQSPHRVSPRTGDEAANCAESLPASFRLPRFRLTVPSAYRAAAANPEAGLPAIPKPVAQDEARTRPRPMGPTANDQPELRRKASPSSLDHHRARSNPVVASHRSRSPTASPVTTA